MSLNVGQIPSLTMELAALEHLKFTLSPGFLCSELSALKHRKLWCLQTLYWLSGERSLPIGLLVELFFFILAGNKDNRKISHGFEIQQDQSRDL